MKKIIYCLAFFSLLSSASLTLASSPDGKQYVGFPIYLDDSFSPEEGRRFKSNLKNNKITREFAPTKETKIVYMEEVPYDMIVLDVTKLKKEMEESELRDKIKSILPRQDNEPQKDSKILFSIFEINKNDRNELEAYENNNEKINLQKRYKSLEDIDNFDYMIYFKKEETSSSNANKNINFATKQDNDNNDNTPLTTKKTNSGFWIGCAFFLTITLGLTVYHNINQTGKTKKSREKK